MGGLDMMLPTMDKQKQDAKYNDVAVVAKAILADRLKPYFKKLYPQTGEQVVTNFYGAYKRHKQQLSYVTGATGSDTITEGSLYSGGKFYSLAEVSSVDSSDFDVWFYSGVPNSSTFANSADNGDFLINTADAAPVSRLYINRGTTATPSWSVWNTDDLIDYIQTPSALTNLYYRIIAWKLYEFMSNQQNAADGSRLDYYIRQRDYHYSMIDTELPVAVSNMGSIDISNDGFISDFERSSTNTSTRAMFA
jgi:hypothetical protein